jgi:hypothetical protein
MRGSLDGLEIAVQDSERQRDIFISYAHRDAASYVQPLAEALAERDVSFWLDTVEIRWGDTITIGINDGLRVCRYALICLSDQFIERPWPEHELSAALAMRQADGQSRVLPLILNSRDKVLREYPLIAGIAYREFDAGVAVIADEIAALVKPDLSSGSAFHVVVESIHTGRTVRLSTTEKHSVKWVVSKAVDGLGLRREADTGGFQGFPIRWVLVDVAAEAFWKTMPVHERDRTCAVVKTKEADNDIAICHDDLTSVGELGLREGAVVHLYAVPDPIMPSMVGGAQGPVRVLPLRPPIGIIKRSG